MTLNQLNPTIQSWVDSDEFIDSVVSVAQEFALLSTAPLIEVTFGLMTKTIKPEEFKTSLLASLPPDKQNEAIVSKFVHALLLPIKEPLAESGIDISVIAPLDETLAVSYAPSAPETLVEKTVPESLIIPLDKTVAPAPGEPTSLSSPESLIVPLNNISALPESVTPIPSTPTETAVVEPGPASSDIAPTHSTETTTTPSFNNQSDAYSSLPVNKNTSINDPLSASTPFVIHEEKVIERASQSFNHTKELLRPLFYYKEIEKEDTPSFVNLEFKPPENNDDKNS